MNTVYDVDYLYNQELIKHKLKIGDYIAPETVYINAIPRLLENLNPIILKIAIFHYDEMKDEYSLLIFKRVGYYWEYEDTITSDNCIIKTINLTFEFKNQDSKKVLILRDFSYSNIGLTPYQLNFIKDNFNIQKTLTFDLEYKKRLAIIDEYINLIDIKNIITRTIADMIIVELESSTSYKITNRTEYNINDFKYYRSIDNIIKLIKDYNFYGKNNVKLIIRLMFDNHQNINLNLSDISQLSNDELIDRCVNILLNEKISILRIPHAIETAKMSIKISSKFKKHINIQHMIIASIFHDIAKEISIDNMINIIAHERIQKDTILNSLTPINTFEYNNIIYLHGIIGAIILYRLFNIKEINILDSIRCHKIPSEKFSLFKQILIISDYANSIRIDKNKQRTYDELIRSKFDILKAYDYILEYNSEKMKLSQ